MYNPYVPIKFFTKTLALTNGGGAAEATRSGLVQRAAYMPPHEDDKHKTIYMCNHIIYLDCQQPPQRMTTDDKYV